MENRAIQLQTVPQLHGIAQVAVVSQCHFSLLMIDLNGLAVAAAGAAGSSISHMAHGHGTGGQPGQGVGVEYFADKPKILPGEKHSIVIHHNPAAFLTPVLQSVQAVIDQIGNVVGLGSENTENAAFFMQTHGIPPFRQSNVPRRRLHRRMLKIVSYCRGRKGQKPYLPLSP